MSPPLTAKIRSGPNGVEIMIVGSAASLLEGDDISVRLEVSGGSSVVVRSTGAQIAHPCPGGGQTSFTVCAAIGAGCRLSWLVEPTILAAGCDHLGETFVDLAAGAEALWREEVIFGRSAEDPPETRATFGWRVDLDGRPLIRDGFDTTTPGAWSTAVLGERTRIAASLALLGRYAEPPSAATDLSVTRFDLARPGTLWRILSPDVAATRGAIDAQITARASA